MPPTDLPTADATGEFQRICSIPCHNLSELLQWCERAIAWLKDHTRDWTGFSTPAQRFAKEALHRAIELKVDSSAIPLLCAQLPSDRSVMPASMGLYMLQELADCCKHRKNRGAPAPPASTNPTSSKRSTERGEGRDKLIAALTKHHRYADGGYLNQDPIGNNELARLAGVAKRTASAFFSKEFQGHRKYKALCTDAGRLASALKLLNGEFAPHVLYGSKPPGEAERKDNADE
jgi:hypothetical protein